MLNKPGILLCFSGLGRKKPYNMSHFLIYDQTIMFLVQNPYAKTPQNAKTVKEALRFMCTIVQKSSKH